ncbi:ATP-binding protein, partial [Streptomyces sp. SID8455]|nr:ATP-binding protein [Streptomyces sp. SID8455]
MDSAVSEAPLFAPRQPGPRDQASRPVDQAEESLQAWQLDHTRAP